MLTDKNWSIIFLINLPNDNNFGQFNFLLQIRWSIPRTLRSGAQFFEPGQLPWDGRTARRDAATSRVSSVDGQHGSWSCSAPAWPSGQWTGSGPARPWPRARPGRHEHGGCGPRTRTQAKLFPTRASCEGIAQDDFQTLFWRLELENKRVNARVSV